MILFIIPPHNSYLNIIQLSIYSTFYFLQYVTVEGKEHSLPTGKLISVSTVNRADNFSFSLNTTRKVYRSRLFHSQVKVYSNITNKNECP